MSEPTHIIMDNDKATRGLIVTPELDHSLPGLPEAFQAVDRVQNQDRPAYLADLYGSVFNFRHRLGRVTCAALWNNAASGNTEVLATWPPFTDCAPRGQASRLADYSEKDSANLLDVMLARPNSARQLLKMGTSNELEHALGRGLVVLGFFAFTPMRTYSLRDRKAIFDGDFGGAAEILEHGIAEVQDRLHGPHSETQLTDLHIAGASQGAHQAIASAGRIAAKEGKLGVKSLTIQEPILEPDKIPQLTSV